MADANKHHHHHHHRGSSDESYSYESTDDHHKHRVTAPVKKVVPAANEEKPLSIDSIPAPSKGPPKKAHHSSSRSHTDDDSADSDHRHKGASGKPAAKRSASPPPAYTQATYGAPAKKDAKKEDAAKEASKPPVVEAVRAAPAPKEGSNRPADAKTEAKAKDEPVKKADYKQAAYGEKKEVKTDKENKKPEGKKDDREEEEAVVEVTTTQKATYGQKGNDDISPEGRQRPSEAAGAPKYNDVCFAILFFLHFIGIILILAIRWGSNNGFTNGQTDDATNSTMANSTMMNSTMVNGTATNATATYSPIVYRTIAIHMIIIFVVSVILASIVSYVLLHYLRHHAIECIKAGICFFLLTMVVFTIVNFLSGQIWAGVIFALNTLVCALMFYAWRSMIPFAALMIETVLDIVFKHPGLTAVPFVGQGIYLVYVIIWALAMSTISNSPLILIYMMFSYFWMGMVVKYVTHCIIVGVVGEWFFAKGDMSKNPTMGSVKRALTYSFGSICFAALIMALWKTFRWIMHQIMKNMRNDGFWALLKCCLECCMNCIETYMEFFTRFSLVHTALYGHTYCESAKETWELFKSEAGVLIMGDNFIFVVEWLFDCGGSLAVVIVTGIWSYVALHKYGAIWWIFPIWISFLLAFTIINTIMEVIESGNAALYVAWLEYPEAIQFTKPELSAELHKRFGAATGRQNTGSNGV